MKNFTYRKHLDAIRGFACIAVVLFHTDLPLLSNGFVGVDVFFVLSGYLISSILIRQIAQIGSVNFSEFYCRRFRRLFPASCVTLILTALLYRLREVPEYVEKHAPTFIASSLYYENWYGLTIAMDYFTDKGSDQSPVVHFWSLSIEEQFYLFFPICLFLICKLFCNNLYYIFNCFLILFAGSMYVNYRLWTQSEMISYFSTFGRVYQLIIGTLLAIIIFSVEKSDKTKQKVDKFLSTEAKNVLDFLSGLIIFAFVQIIISCEMPAYYMGIVTSFMTFMLIFTLEFSAEDGLVKKYFLHNPIISLLGKISYGMYLTHVPICKFGDIFAIFPENLHQRAFLIFILTVFVSVIFQYAIEAPVAKNVVINKETVKRVLIFFTILTVLQPLLLGCILYSSFPINQLGFQKDLEPTDELCSRVKKLGSVLLTGDSYTLAWIKPFRDVHKGCNFTFRYSAYFEKFE